MTFEIEELNFDGKNSRLVGKQGRDTAGARWKRDLDKVGVQKCVYRLPRSNNRSFGTQSFDPQEGEEIWDCVLLAQCTDGNCCSLCHGAVLLFEIRWGYSRLRYSDGGASTNISRWACAMPLYHGGRGSFLLQTDGIQSQPSRCWTWPVTSSFIISMNPLKQRNGFLIFFFFNQCPLSSIFFFFFNAGVAALLFWTWSHQLASNHPKTSPAFVIRHPRRQRGLVILFQSSQHPLSC